MQEQQVDIRIRAHFSPSAATDCDNCRLQLDARSFFGREFLQPLLKDRDDERVEQFRLQCRRVDGGGTLGKTLPDLATNLVEATFDEIRGKGLASASN